MDDFHQKMLVVETKSKTPLASLEEKKRKMEQTFRKPSTPALIPKKAATASKVESISSLKRTKERSKVNDNGSNLSGSEKKGILINRNFLYCTNNINSNDSLVYLLF